MNKLNKVISMLLAVAMIMSVTSIMTFAEGTNKQEVAEVLLDSAAASTKASLPNDDVAYADAYKFDYSLGIFELLEDGYWQNETVTRSEFATIVAKMLKANTSGYPRHDYSPYSDVDATNFAYPSICYLTEIGILAGDGNSTFRPNDPILVAEATKMIMCAIGFKDACEVTGGYPNGYTTFAQRQGIYNNLTLSFTGSMTALQMSKMVRNALEAYIMDTIVYNSDGSAQAMVSDTKTLLTETYELINLRGYVEGTYFSYLSGAEVSLANEVMIDGICYQFDENFDMEALLAYEVNFYYMDDVSGYRRPYIAYCEPRGSVNTEVDLMSRDIVSLSSENIVYNDKNDREKKITIDAGTEVSYNGKPYFDLNEDTLAIKEGHVKVVMNDSSTRAAAIIIQEQFDGLFERYNKTSYQVIFQDNMTTVLPQIKFDTAFRTRLTLDGEIINPEDLVKNDAITYCVSKDGDYIRGYVSRQEDSGTIEKVETQEYPAGLFKIVTLNGTEYFISAYCTKEINAGFTSDYQITYDGRIIGTKSSANSMGNYGYLVKFASDGGVFNDTFRVKILDKNGNLAEYVSARKVNSNVNFDKGVAQYTPAEIVNSGLFDDPQVVVFETNSNNEIRTLYAAVDYTKSLEDPDDLDFGMYFTGSARYSNNLLASSAVNDSTLIFKVPFTDRDHDEDYTVQKAADLGKTSYRADIYDIRKGVANVVVIKDTDPTSLSNTANVLIIDQLSTAWDEDSQQRVTEVQGWLNGELVSYKIDEDISQANSLTGEETKSVNEFARGDVIQFNTASNGYLYNYRVLFNATLRVGEDMYFEMNQSGQKVVQLSNDELYTLFGEVKSVFDYFIVETTDVAKKELYRAYPTTGINLYIYDTDKDEIVVGEPFDIEVGNQVFIRTKNLTESVDMLVIQ